jgi:hypothetical protein
MPVNTDSDRKCCSACALSGLSESGTLLGNVTLFLDAWRLHALYLSAITVPGTAMGTAHSIAATVTGKQHVTGEHHSSVTPENFSHVEYWH